MSSPAATDTSARARDDGARTCVWCRRPIGDMRPEARTCSKKCRQSAWRFQRQMVRATTADAPIRICYADPPYPGLAARYYRDHPDYAGEVDHRALLSRLQAWDGWALSTSADALPYVLGLAWEMGIDTAVASWHRGVRYVRSTTPLQGWEPVVYRGGRHVASLAAVPDALDLVARPRFSDPDRVVGAKPVGFACWVFQLLGAARGDTFDDLFPGSGGMRRAWDVFVGEGP